jgi:uncharacterized protein (TIGR02266 family)
LEVAANKTKPTHHGKRLTKRFPARFDVAFDSPPHFAVQRGVNISRGGLFVETLHPPPVGTTVLVTIRFPLGERLQADAQVVHVVTQDQASGQSYPPGVGLSFSSEHPKFRERLAELVADYEPHRPQVLVVDDDEDFRLALAEGLEDEGMSVATAASGEEALQKLIDGFFELDVVLLDLRMPGFGGHGFLDRVRRLGGELDLRIIVLSGAPPHELSALKGPTGANEVLSKSNSLDVIVERIRSVLGKTN